MTSIECLGMQPIRPFSSNEVVAAGGRLKRATPGRTFRGSLAQRAQNVGKKMINMMKRAFFSCKNMSCIYFCIYSFIQVIMIYITYVYIKYIYIDVFIILSFFYQLYIDICLETRANTCVLAVD